ncbi:MAG: RNA polymerase factor sigma-54 [Anaerolineales bacterium]
MLRQIQRQTQRPLTSAHLIQTMSLLHLSADELRESVERELSVNPALEQVEPPACPGCGRSLARPGTCPICAAKNDEVIVFTSPLEMMGSGANASTRDPSQETDREDVPESLSLAAHLLRQIGPELTPAERPIAAHLLTALDDDGLLTSDPAEVAAYFHLPRLQVERVRELIQRAEPFGCASTSPGESLRIQLHIIRESREIPPAAEACLLHFDLLARRQWKTLAEQTGFGEDAIGEAARFIGANLNPYPARAYWGGVDPPQPVYRTPDVVIRLSGETLVVEIAQPFAGSLRVNPLFRQALREASPEKLEAWQNDLERARLLVKCAAQRAGALEEIMTRLAQTQREFILQGESKLRPLTRTALAQQLGLHESTISRAVSGKSVQLPNGRIVPLSMFFEKHLNVRATLRELVCRESHPLTDDELAESLRRAGFVVARRTVSKYRAMEGILPAHLRRR